MTTLLAASIPSLPLEASVPWFERITVTVDDQGTQRSCQYQLSLTPGGPKPCDQNMASTVPATAKASSGVYSKLTFERRFSPAPKLDSVRLRAGDKLLAQQVMFLTISEDGSIAACRVVGRSGDMMPAYGCDEARAEQFRVPATSAGTPRQAFMTILVYGHQEQIA
jgi:hypothetical protein